MINTKNTLYITRLNERNLQATTVTLPAHQVRGGTVRSLSLKNVDRDIVFPKNTLYAVVLAGYFVTATDSAYTTHRTEQAAIKRYQKLKAQGMECDIISRNGDYMYVERDYFNFKLTNYGSVLNYI